MTQLRNRHLKRKGKKREETLVPWCYQMTRSFPVSLARYGNELHTISYVQHHLMYLLKLPRTRDLKRKGQQETFSLRWRKITRPVCLNAYRRSSLQRHSIVLESTQVLKMCWESLHAGCEVSANLRNYLNTSRAKMESQSENSIWLYSLILFVMNE